MQTNINQRNYNTNRERHGLWELYYDNGQLGYKCIYNNGNPVGLSKFYNKLGILIEQKYYAR
jgi:antitoxin component YwqK of YwqJK toxin-antitoxin module